MTEKHWENKIVPVGNENRNFYVKNKLNLKHILIKTEW